MSQLTQERLLALFSYDPTTGKLRRRKRLRSVGFKNEKGYLITDIDNRNYRVHRLIWLMIYGKWPDGVIDHIDGDISNNRLENLQDVSNSVNIGKAKIAKNNRTGFKGVWHFRDKFGARITIAGTKHFLGYHKTPQEAARAIEEFKTC